MISIDKKVMHKFKRSFFLMNISKKPLTREKSIVKFHAVDISSLTNNGEDGPMLIMKPINNE